MYDISLRFQYLGSSSNIRLEKNVSVTLNVTNVCKDIIIIPSLIENVVYTIQVDIHVYVYFPDWVITNSPSICPETITTYEVECIYAAYPSLGVISFGLSLLRFDFF